MLDEILNGDSEPTPADRRSADIGIVCTHRREIGPLLKLIDRQRTYVDDGATFRGGFLDETTRVAVVEAGVGFARHRRMAETLLNEHHPVWILSVGFSSALTADLQSGDLCLANEICDTHGNSMVVKCPISESRRIFVRKHVVADSHPSTADQKRVLAESTGATAVDTTSLAVAQVCAAGDDEKLRARFFSVRGIIDANDESLSAKALELLFAPAALQKIPLLDVVKKKLRPDPEVAPWEERSTATAKNLSRFLVGTIRQLAEKISR